MSACHSIQPTPACHFCGDPSLYVCDFRVEREVETSVTQLQAGNRVVTFSGSPRKPVRLVWEVIYFSGEAEAVYVGFRKGDDGAVVQRRLDAGETCWVLRHGSCENPCCYNCVREPGENFHLCRGQHWSLPVQ